MRRFFVCTVLTVATTLLVPAQNVRGQAEDFDFSISETFLKMLADGHTVLPTLRMRMDARTATVHLVSKDCEIHIAAKPEDDLGWPDPIVVEPPNLCANKPVGMSGTPSKKALRETIWPQRFDQLVMNRTCDVKGFPRIFTEHAGGASHAANPLHVFEIHPATSITCAGQTLAFGTFLKSVDGLPNIKPSTAATCIDHRRLRVRFQDGEYQFKQDSGGNCGNFAVVEVGNLRKDWIRETDGGHSAIARVSADGETRSSLKIYTLTGSEGDAWLHDVDQNGLGAGRVYLHGLFTYDYFSIIRAVRTPAGQWQRPPDWVQVDFPLAFIVFGKAKRAPWEET